MVYVQPEKQRSLDFCGKVHFLPWMELVLSQLLKCGFPMVSYVLPQMLDFLLLYLAKNICDHVQNDMGQS